MMPCKMATEQHPNAARLQASFDAFARGDIPTLRALFAPDFVWHVSSPKRFAGDRHGWSEFQDYLGLLRRETGGTMRMEPFELFANDAYAVALLRISRSRLGGSVSNFAAQVVRFEDGLVVEGWFLDENPYELDELYGQSS
jgi:ketosteroid isomerase-like protein